MKKDVSALSTIILTIIVTLFFLPISGITADDPYLDAGFIKTKQKVIAPDFALENLEGKNISLSDYRGKNVLVFFWTTW